MGMYTELHYNVELKKDTPDTVIALLKFMVGESEVEPTKKPNEPLFDCDRWRVMLRMDSYYFSADTNSTLRFDDRSRTYHLCVRSNLKNYDSEIEKFINWMNEYVYELEVSFLGIYRNEESEIPTLIYKT